MFERALGRGNLLVAETVLRTEVRRPTLRDLLERGERRMRRLREIPRQAELHLAEPMTAEQQLAEDQRRPSTLS
jgi:hypothetical protein